MPQDHRWDLTPYVAELTRCVDEHELAPGLYSRWSDRSRPGAEHPPDPYGGADAANILYTLAQFPAGAEHRQQFVRALQGFQDPQTGAFHDPTHSKYHTTAHVVAALELFEARPAHPLTFLEPLTDHGALRDFLDSRNWDNPWRSSHDGAGFAAALAIAADLPSQWVEAYIGWLDEHADPETGFWRRGNLQPMDESPGLFGNLAGSFHYHFNYLYFRRPWPYPERVIDACLDILADSAHPLAHDQVGFAEIDWVFCLHRAFRQTGHRPADVRQGLESMAQRVCTIVLDEAYWRTEHVDDLHTAFGGLCAVAELQLALPGLIHTPRPLRLVLDRRPFI